MREYCLEKQMCQCRADPQHLLHLHVTLWWPAPLLKVHRRSKVTAPSYLRLYLKADFCRLVHVGLSQQRAALQHCPQPLVSKAAALPVEAVRAEAQAENGA